MGFAVGLLVLAGACEKPLADAQTPAPALKPGELGYLSTASMPDGIKVEVQQAAYFLPDDKGKVTKVGGDLDYVFRFSSGRRIQATVSEVTPTDGEPVVLMCEPSSAGSVPYSQCRSWPEMRQVLLTLYAMGHTGIAATEGKGRVNFDRASTGITDTDIAAWVARASVGVERTQ